MSALPVALPLLAAALLLALGSALPRRGPDLVAILVALAVAGLGLLLALRDDPAPTWFGGWTPEHGVPLGIAFAADLAGSAMAVLLGLLFAACFVFAWGYFEAVRAQFHVLMLVFLGAMAGFCLTRDLFNLFVWFEVMSVTAFALTAYHLEGSGLEGALNFTVTNTLGSMLMLGGIGLLYLRLGMLDMAALGAAAAGRGPDPVLAAGFCLLTAALLIKAAIVPFHFWLADAHAVAPSPVSVIFSGAMVAMGVFGLARLSATVFAGVPAAEAARGLLAWLGIATAVLGGTACLQQRHIKRLLAFSTISHTGIQLAGLALRPAAGLAGSLAYMVGHGLAKAALFMVAGILLSACGGIDEIGLRGRGRAVWPAGLAFLLGGVLLAGAPFGLLDAGTAMIDAAGGGKVTAPLLLGAALTGGAVLRATGRVFLGWGEVAGEEEHAPTEEEREKPNRPLWLMLAPAALLLALAVGLGPFGQDLALRAADGLRGAPGPTAPPAPPHPWLPWLALSLAFLIAGWDLGRRHLPRRLVALVQGVSGPGFAALDRLHSGLVGDYVAAILAGLALLALGAAGFGGLTGVALTLVNPMPVQLS